MEFSCLTHQLNYMALVWCAIKIDSIEKCVNELQFPLQIAIKPNRMVYVIMLVPFAVCSMHQHTTLFIERMYANFISLSESNSTAAGSSWIFSIVYLLIDVKATHCVN